MKQAWFLEDPTTDPAQLPEDGWRKVSLPHQWTLEGRELEVGWYRLEFPQALGRRWAEVRADYYCEAWIGETYQGRHAGYFEPWVLEIPPESNLLLRVSAPKEELGTAWPRFKQQIKGAFGQHVCRPGANTPHGQERGTGGLWGGVRYFRTGPAAVLNLGWQAVKIATGWKLWIRLEIDTATEDRSFGAELRQKPLKASLNLVLSPDGFQGEILSTQRTLDLIPGRQTYTLVWDLPEMPRWEVWERGFPHLFDLRVELDDQAISTCVGFRTISQDEHWLKLNEERLFLRGTNIIPTQWLAGYTVEQAQRDVELIREAHLNAARVHAHLTHPVFYEACDRQGVLVWQDFPLQWGYATDEAFAEEAVCQAQAMVKHYGSHPSIYLWCAHNEPTHNRHTLDPLLAAAIRQADPTRIVKEASTFSEHAYPGWYTGHLRDFLAAPSAPLPAEFGAQALPRADLLAQILGEAAWPPDWETWVYHNFQPDQTFRMAGVQTGETLEEFVANSQDYQARLLKFAIEAYRRAKGGISGYFQFMFVEPWPAITWAVLDVEREPKKGYFAMQEASSPVLISLVLSRESIETGQPPLQEVWVVNDLLRSLHILVKLRLEGPTTIPLREIEQDIPAQKACCIFHIDQIYEDPAKDRGLGQLNAQLRRIPAGAYRLVGEVCEGETLLSRSEEAVVYLPPTVPLPEGW